MGTVTIKKRGSAVDVRLRRDLKLRGSETAVVVLTRFGSRPYCLLCAEVAAGEDGGSWRSSAAVSLYITVCMVLSPSHETTAGLSLDWPR